MYYLETVTACCAYNMICVPDQETKKHDWGRGSTIIQGASSGGGEVNWWTDRGVPFWLSKWYPKI